MQAAAAGKNVVSTSPKVIVFHARMGAQAPLPSERAQRLQLNLSIRGNIAEYALAKPDDLKHDLPNVRATLQAASKNNIKVSLPVLSDLQKGLNAIDPGTPGYWPTAAEFIGYRSQV